MPDPQNDVKRSFLQWLVAEDIDRQDRIRQYREYYDGKHDTQLTDRQRAYLELKIGQEFNGNYCPIPVDALAEKLTITGVDAGDQQTPILWDWMTKNKLDGIQGIVHNAALRDGDAYVLVGWNEDENRPQITFEPACCDGEGVKVHYSEEDRSRVEFASRRWRISQGPGAGSLRRLNLYYPDRIEKYMSAQAGEGDWRLLEPPSAWVAWDGAPLGVTAVHFKNKEQGYSYGNSELSDVIPLQNAFNKSLIDLLAASDTTAFRIFWMLGDNPAGVKVAPGSFIYSLRPPAGPDGAAIGYFPGEDLSPLIALKDSMAMEIARITRTPLSYFQISGQVAAEGTLKQQEAPLVAKAKKRQVYFGNSWENVLRLCRRLHNTFGSGPRLDETQAIEIAWASAETRNTKEDMDMMLIKSQLGVPDEQIWEELGYSEDKITKFTELKQAAEQRQGNVGEMLLRGFERGGGGNAAANTGGTVAR